MPNTLVTDKFLAEEIRRILLPFCATPEQRNALEKMSKEVSAKLLDLGLIHQSKKESTS